jgi:hypothetical protein
LGPKSDAAICRTVSLELKVVQDEFCITFPAGSSLCTIVPGVDNHVNVPTTLRAV